MVNSFVILGEVILSVRLGVVLLEDDGAVECLVTLGVLVVGAVFFLKVLFAVRVVFRLVKVVSLLRAVVTLGVFGVLPVPGVGEVLNSVLSGV